MGDTSLTGKPKVAFSFAPETCGFDVFSLKRQKVTCSTDRENVHRCLFLRYFSPSFSLFPLSSSSQVVLNFLLVKQLHLYFPLPSHCITVKGRSTW